MARLLYAARRRRSLAAYPAPVRLVVEVVAILAVLLTVVALGARPIHAQTPRPAALPCASATSHAAFTRCERATLDTLDRQLAALDARLADAKRHCREMGGWTHTAPAALCVLPPVDTARAAVAYRPAAARPGVFALVTSAALVLGARDPDRGGYVETWRNADPHGAHFLGGAALAPLGIRRGCAVGIAYEVAQAAARDSRGSFRDATFACAGTVTARVLTRILFRPSPR